MKMALQPSYDRHNKPKVTNVINFHDNYLKLGLWPELNYEKQMLLRNSYKQIQNSFGRKGMCKTSRGDEEQIEYSNSSA